MRGEFTQQHCPRCGGNMFLDRDLYGWYEYCLQCGHTTYLDTIVEGRERTDVGSLVQDGGIRTTR